MGRNPDMSRIRHLCHAAAFVAVVAVAGGCAVFGGGGGDEPGDPGPAVQAVQVPEPEPADTTIEPRLGSMEERLRAGDYGTVLATYAADSTLHTNEDATYRAGVAAAMSGHPGHDPRRASNLFERLLREHPNTSRRLEIELYLDLLSQNRDLRSTIGRLDRELKQLKAIDLGQAPEDGRP